MIKTETITHRRHSVLGIPFFTKDTVQSRMKNLILKKSGYKPCRKMKASKNRVSVTSTPTSSELAMEQLIFDLYVTPASPQKTPNRRQSLPINCQKLSLKKMIFGSGDICPESPTPSELVGEQFIFDLYLNSPTKQRRMLQNEKDWDHRQAIKAMSQESPRTGCIPRVSLSPYSCQAIRLNSRSNSS